MLSVDQQFKIDVGSNDEEKIQYLTSVINDQSTSDVQRIKCRQLRVVINYEQKRWKKVLDDINVLEQTNDCGSLSVLKIKANIQECCRKARLSILEMINNGDNTDEHETLLLNIKQENIDELIDGHMPTKRSLSTSKANKKFKK